MGVKHPICWYVDGVTHCYQCRVYIGKIMGMTDFKLMEFLCENLRCAIEEKLEILEIFDERAHAQPFGLALCDTEYGTLSRFDHQHALKTRRWQYEAVQYRKWWRRFDLTCARNARAQCPTCIGGTALAVHSNEVVKQNLDVMIW